MLNDTEPASLISPPPATPAAVDIAIVGGGLSGSLAAVVLGRAGYRVALIDLHETYPPEFRVEKIAGEQVELLRRLGLLEAVAGAASRFDEILNIRKGRVIDRSRAPHFGILYEELVRTVRAQIPPQVSFVVGRVLDLKTGPEHQQIILATGEPIAARLIGLATGMGDALRFRLGIKRRVIAEKQSLSFGFNLVPKSGTVFDFAALTCYGERLGDRIDYLSLFPTSAGMRANLFTFRDHTDPWIREFRQNPKPVLLAALPGVAAFLGDFEIAGRVQNWLMDISVADNPRQDGVVLIGDAFQTSCPAAGTGVSRLLTDVERLCTVHVPDWFATPGMGVDKIAGFYDDPAKQAMDSRALALAEYRRALTVETNFGWSLRRQAMFLRRRFIALIDQLSPRGAARLRALRAAAR